ncbi:MAG: hypothetical protein DBY36_02320 [Clostridiales bacterium]|nr:MAG: hypothetical protein DBY36_02320 [Clostridiales bacterium]
MASFIRNAEVKAMTAVMTAKEKARGICARAKDAVMNREGQGTLDVAVTVLISIVLGALILGGLYLIVNGTVLPSITEKIKEMFNYKG